MARRLLRVLGWAVTGVSLLLLTLIVVYRFINPPLTPLMVLRWVQGEGIDYRPVAFADISADLARAVIASEDNNFCRHFGVDWGAVAAAVEDYQDGEDLRGASTITMQLARNLVLWPGGGFLRKGVEVGLAHAIELLWSKPRIMEAYLNIIEFGPGIYGAEAAARHHFGLSARQISRQQAALLAAVLPSPRRFDAGSPSAYISRRGATISRRIGQMGSYLDCIGRA